MSAAPNFPFLGLPQFLWSKAEIKRYVDHLKKESERRVKLAVPWSVDMPWKYELNLKASTYKPRHLFKGPKQTRQRDPNNCTPDEVLLSSEGNFGYVVHTLRKGHFLDTCNPRGGQKGNVVFDKNVPVPTLYERRGTMWNDKPWMSLTPHELMSLHPGTLLAKGRVVVAGLGLGHQLIEVSKRKEVKEVVLVECSQELVDFLLEPVKKHMDLVPKVIVGDAYEVLPKLSADIALIDIFRSYGSNRFTRWQPRADGHCNEEVPIACPRIKRIWCWGSGSVR